MLKPERGQWYYCNVYNTASNGLTNRLSPFMTFQVLYYQGYNQWSNDIKGLLPVHAEVDPQSQVEVRNV